jgi:hypothetical protein
MHNVVCVSRLFLFCLSSLLSVYAQCRLCLWIVFVLFDLAVECFMPNVTCVPGLFLFCLSSLLSVLCRMSPVSLDCYFCFL